MVKNTTCIKWKQNFKIQRQVIKIREQSILKQ